MIESSKDNWDVSRRLRMSRVVANEYMAISHPPRKLVRGLWYRMDINIADRSIARIKKKNTTPSLTNDWNNGEIRFVSLKLPGPSRKMVARVIKKNIVAIMTSGIHAIRVNLTLGKAKHPGHGRPSGAGNTVCDVAMAALTEA